MSLSSQIRARPDPGGQGSRPFVEDRWRCRAAVQAEVSDDGAHRLTWPLSTRFAEMSSRERNWRIPASYLSVAAFSGTEHPKEVTVLRLNCGTAEAVSSGVTAEISYIN